jgi:parallel beta-helix repeat protein
MKTVCIGAAALIACAAAAPAHAATAVGPRDSIQAAVDAAAPGDTIVVRGTHRENVAVGKDGITLHGAGAVLEPPAAPATNACYDPTDPDEVVHGICVSGDVDFATGEIQRYVERVTVTGFTVRGFTGNGISAAAARDATLAGNVTEGNGDGGIAAIGSTGVRMRSNRTAGNRFGIYVGSSVGGSIAGNAVHDNCVGVFVLAAFGPAGAFGIAANAVRDNTKACPAAGDWPALSGAGVALVGASDTTVAANVITGNVPAGETALGGGVAVVSEPGGTAPERNLVTANVIAGNEPDIFWDRSGTGNAFRGNHCRGCE